MKKNASDDSLHERFGPVGKKVQFTREQLIDRASNALKNNKSKGININECIEYINKLK